MFVRHRICEGLTGIGSSDPVVLDNNVELKDKGGRYQITDLEPFRIILLEERAPYAL